MKYFLLPKSLSAIAANWREITIKYNNNKINVFNQSNQINLYMSGAISEIKDICFWKFLFDFNLNQTI